MSDLDREMTALRFLRLSQAERVEALSKMSDHVTISKELDSLIERAAYAREFIDHMAWNDVGRAETAAKKFVKRVRRLLACMTA